VGDNPEFLSGLGKAQLFGDSHEIAHVTKLHWPEHHVDYSKKLSRKWCERVCFLQGQLDEGVFDIAFGYGSGTEEVLD
jgi:hypothetical protein